MLSDSMCCLLRCLTCFVCFNIEVFYHSWFSFFPCLIKGFLLLFKKKQILFFFRYRSYVIAPHQLSQCLSLICSLVIIQCFPENRTASTTGSIIVNMVPCQYLIILFYCLHNTSHLNLSHSLIHAYPSSKSSISVYIQFKLLQLYSHVYHLIVPLDEDQKTRILNAHRITLSPESRIIPGA